MGRGSWITLVAVAAVGVIAIVVAGCVTSDFWLGLWLNVGSSALLFSALYLVERLVLERRVETARTEIAAEAKAEIAAVRHEVATTIEELRTRFAEQLDARHAQDIELVDDARERVGTQSIGRLLTRAAELSAVTADGPRVAVGHGYERLRFSPPDEQGVIAAVLETYDGRELRRLTWAPKETADVLFVRVVDAMESVGCYEPFDPGELMLELVETLEVAIGARTGRRGKGPSDLNPVIEIVGKQWAVTDYGIEAIGPHRYPIEHHRLRETDWYRHVSRKSWVNEDEFAVALDVAQALFCDPSDSDPS